MRWNRPTAAGGALLGQRWIAGGAAWLVLSCVAMAQQGQTGEAALTVSSVQAMRRTVERNQQFSAERRQQVLELYDQALQSLNDETALRRTAARYERERANVGRSIRALQAELDRPTREPRLSLPANASMERISQLLTQERAELEARRQVVQEADKQSERRSSRRTEIAKRIGLLTQQAEGLTDQLRSLDQAEMPTGLKEPTRVQLRAALQRARQEIRTLRSEALHLDARTDLVPLQKDRAQRRVAQSERLVAMLESRAQQRRQADAAASLDRVRKACDTATAQVPLLGELAAETSRYADQLWGAGGVTMTLEDASRQITVVRRQASEVQQITSLTRRKFEAVRLRGIAAQWWPQTPDDLPQQEEIRQANRRREALLPNVQYELIVLQERRVNVGNIENEVADWMARLSEVSDLDPKDLERTVRQLVGMRRKLLDELIKNKSRWADELFELTNASRDLRTAIVGLDRYIYERVFWVRSVPGPKIPPLRDVTGAVKWLFWNAEWGHVFHTALGKMFTDFWLVLCLVAVAPLLYFRRSLLNFLADQAHQARDPHEPRFTPTLRALVATVALSVPLPAILWWFGRFLSAAVDSTLAHAASDGLIYSSVGAGMIVLLIEIMRPEGLGDAHFSWSSTTTKAVRQELTRFLWRSLPAVVICYSLGTSGLRFHSEPELRAFSNGLGRLSFIYLEALIVWTAFRILNPRGELMTDLAVRRPEFWITRLRFLWFPGLMLALAVPAALAINGYYVTGFVLVSLTTRTLWLGLGLVLVQTLLARWRATRRKRGLRTDTGSPSSPPDSFQSKGAGTSEQGVRKLTAFLLGLVWLYGAAAIWTQVIPALQLFNHIQVWPRVEVIESGQPVAVQTQARSAAPAGASAPARGPAAAISSVLEPGGNSEPQPGGGGGPVGRLLLSDVLWSLISLLVTVVVAKNVPALLDFAFLQRMPIAPGVRTATNTLVRYGITLIGISISASLLGLSWQKVQWLAAALTFGLGFGLQEIFANFVSGLIILIDRPVRTGDIVTVGDAGGWVTKISIRATTITRWDRSELIVPNKDLITNPITNWTLSNQTTRVAVKVGVEYGTDVEQVREVLLEVARQHPAVYKDPPPYAVLMDFGDNSINFELRVYVNYEYGRLTIRDEIQRRIVAAFAKEAIVIAFPQLDVRVKSDRPAGPPEPLTRKDTSSPTPRGLAGDDTE